VNYHQPRQVDPKSDRPDAGKWRYTCMNDGKVWAEGYCAGCPGHDTREGAYQHQTQYVLENKVRLGVEHPNEQRRCMKCGEWTTKTARVDHLHYYELCDEHCNIEVVTELFGSVGDSYGSW
jgi:hypothetical protein